MAGRPLAETDLPQLLRWAEDAALWQYAAYAGLSSAEYWRSVLGSAARRCFRLMVLKSGEPVGLSCWYGHDASEKRIFTGTVVGRRDLWGRGLGTRIKQWQVEHLFERHDIIEICSTLARDNHAMLKILGKLGYVPRDDIDCPAHRSLEPARYRTLALRRRDWAGVRGEAARSAPAVPCGQCLLRIDADPLSYKLPAVT